MYMYMSVGIDMYVLRHATVTATQTLQPAWLSMPKTGYMHVWNSAMSTCVNDKGTVHVSTHYTV